MPGNCLASLRPTAARLWKTFRSKLSAIPVIGENCSLSPRNRVHLHTGMLFGITTECCSASERNRVHLRPDSPADKPLVVVCVLSQFHGVSRSQDDRRDQNDSDSNQRMFVLKSRMLEIKFRVGYFGIACFESVSNVGSCYHWVALLSYCLKLVVLSSGCTSLRCLCLVVWRRYGSRAL